MTVVGERLRAKYGSPKMIDIDEALRLCDVDVPQDERKDLYAWLYPSREAAEAFQASNRETHGDVTYGPLQTDEGWIGVLDLRSRLAAMRGRATVG